MIFSLLQFATCRVKQKLRYGTRTNRLLTVFTPRAREQKIWFTLTVDLPTGPIRHMHPFFFILLKSRTKRDNERKNRASAVTTREILKYNSLVYSILENIFGIKVKLSSALDLEEHQRECHESHTANEGISHDCVIWVIKVCGRQQFADTNNDHHSRHQSE